MLSIIVAVAKNNVIGKDNKLIWHLPEDLRRFKRLTTNHNIIMGRKTFESLGRVLPNRKHIVLCNDAELNVNDENVNIIDDVSKLDEYINSNEENFVIGGASIYKLLLPKTEKLYITISARMASNCSAPARNVICTVLRRRLRIMPSPSLGCSISYLCPFASLIKLMVYIPPESVHDGYTTVQPCAVLRSHCERRCGP